MSIFKERAMQSHVRKEHLASIRDKFDDLQVAPTVTLQMVHMDRLLKAVTVYILKGGYDVEEE